MNIERTRWRTFGSARVLTHRSRNVGDAWPRPGAAGQRRTPTKILDLCAGREGWGQAAIQRGHDYVALELFRPYEKGKLIMDVRTFADNPGAVLDALVEPGWRPDAVVAGRPCKSSSPGSISTHWELKDGVYTPKTQEARDALEIDAAILRIVEKLQPKYFWLENPRGMMRVTSPNRFLPLAEVTYCKYGEPQRQKPTDLFGRFPAEWVPRPLCKAHKRFGLVERTKAGDVRLPVGTDIKTCKVSGPDRGKIVIVAPDGSERVTEDPVHVCEPDGTPCHAAAPRGAQTGTQGMADAAERAVIPYQLSLDVVVALERALGVTPMIPVAVPQSA